MNTNRGMIRNIQLTWDGVDGKAYSASDVDTFGSNGEKEKLLSVAELDNLAGELYRKFCSRCHIAVSNVESYSAAHASGCAACHFPYNDEGTYRGKDKTVSNKGGMSASHQMEPLPDSTVCSRCHNRSGRIAYSYMGLYDGNNGFIPTVKGEPGAVMSSGARNLVHIQPDIHYSAGMECIDCHTSRDVMGDGYSYKNMYLQTEILCEDCHGSYFKKPSTMRLTRENDDPLRESKSYKQRMKLGMEAVITSKGRPYSNVYAQNGKIWLQSKRTGKIHQVKVITKTPEHSIVGHERLECFTCHSKTVVQCYGCHTLYDKSAEGYDVIKGEDTEGAFSETEDYRKLYPFPLAVNQRGKISTVTPGCQTFVSVKEKDGSFSKSEYVAKFKGVNRLRFAPFYSHNSGTKAVTCSECHSNPEFAGFGQHIIESGKISGTLICEKSDTKPLDGFLNMKKGGIEAFSAITRETSRPLNKSELVRFFSVNLCLECHEKGADRIYRKRISQRALSDNIHRKLVTPR